MALLGQKWLIHPRSLVQQSNCVLVLVTRNRGSIIIIKNPSRFRMVALRSRWAEHGKQSPPSPRTPPTPILHMACHDGCFPISVTSNPEGLDGWMAVGLPVPKISLYGLPNPIISCLPGQYQHPTASMCTPEIVVEPCRIP